LTPKALSHGDESNFEYLKEIFMSKSVYLDCISESQARYYGELYEKHGSSVQAVASGKQAYKDLRYEKLSRVLARDTKCSVYDVGFGLGHFYEYLKNRFPEKQIRYGGAEVTPAFVEHCRKAYPECDFALLDIQGHPLPDKYNYLIFGGTFYHLANSSPDEYIDYVKRVLTNGWLSCDRGMAFNLVTEYVDYRHDSLFYPPIVEVIDFVAKKLSRFFVVDHASPLYEYTITVWREEYMESLYVDDVFSKYFKKIKGCEVGRERTELNGM
jgi:trans-aconitate methyltransferase